MSVIALVVAGVLICAAIVTLFVISSQEPGVPKLSKTMLPMKYGFSSILYPQDHVKTRAILVSVPIILYSGGVVLAIAVRHMSSMVSSGLVLQTLKHTQPDEDHRKHHKQQEQQEHEEQQGQQHSQPEQKSPHETPRQAQHNERHDDSHSSSQWSPRGQISSSLRVSWQIQLFVSFTVISVMALVYYANDSRDLRNHRDTSSSDSLLHLFLLIVYSNAVVHVLFFLCYIAFKRRYNSLEQGAHNVKVSVYVAYVGIFVFVVNFIAALGFQDDQHVSIVVFFVLLMFAGIYYYLYARFTQCFSEEEQHVLFIAYVINANVRGRRRAKLKRDHSNQSFMESVHSTTVQLEKKINSVLLHTYGQTNLSAQGLVEDSESTPPSSLYRYVSQQEKNCSPRSSSSFPAEGKSVGHPGHILTALMSVTHQFHVEEAKGLVHHVRPNAVVPIIEEEPSQRSDTDSVRPTQTDKTKVSANDLMSASRVYDKNNSSSTAHTEGLSSSSSNIAHSNSAGRVVRERQALSLDLQPTHNRGSFTEIVEDVQDLEAPKSITNGTGRSPGGSDGIFRKTVKDVVNENELQQTWIPALMRSNDAGDNARMSKSGHHSATRQSGSMSVKNWLSVSPRPDNADSSPLSRFRASLDFSEDSRQTTAPVATASTRALIAANHAAMAAASAAEDALNDIDVSGSSRVSATRRRRSLGEPAPGALTTLRESVGHLGHMISKVIPIVNDEVFDNYTQEFVDSVLENISSDDEHHARGIIPIYERSHPALP